MEEAWETASKPQRAGCAIPYSMEIAPDDGKCLLINTIIHSPSFIITIVLPGGIAQVELRLPPINKE
jgi:hypothetical protein